MAGQPGSDKVECRVKKPKGGGLNHLQRLLGMREDGVLPTDSVFVSLDIETDEDRQGLHLLDREPRINQVGFATLDTRELLRPWAKLGARISVRSFQVVGRKPRNQHSALIPTMVHQKEVVPIVTRNLRIVDKQTADNNGEPPLRNIVLVGHSIWGDIKILRMLRLDVTSMTHILAILDTHSIARRLFPPYAPGLPPLPNQCFTLAGVLAEFNYRPDRSEFHNAANDAKYTLHAILFLAMKNGMAHQGELNVIEQGNLAKLRQAVSLIVNGESPTTLGAGLLEAARENLFGPEASDDISSLNMTT